MSDHSFCLLGFGFLLTHEMDAIRCREWKVFPVTSGMRDEAGYRAFTALPVPIYALLLWGLYGDGGANRGLVAALDAFFVVRVLLHLLFINHPEYRFTSTFSWALILGAGSLGTIYLLLILRPSDAFAS